MFLKSETPRTMKTEKPLDHGMYCLRGPICYGRGEIIIIRWYCNIAGSFVKDHFSVLNIVITIAIEARILTMTKLEEGSLNENYIKIL